MKGITDYHVHPDYSLDAAPVKIKDYCQRSLELGIREICFTTHLEYGPADQGDDKLISYKGNAYSIFKREWLDSYFKEINQAQSEYKKTGLKIKAGIEIGYHPKYLDEISKVTQEYPFDFVLGAIHYIAGCCIASKVDSVAYFKKKSLAALRQEYFLLLSEAVKSKLFDAIAHIDIYNRYGFKYYGEKIQYIHQGIIEPILENMAHQDMALEVNTSSLSRGLKEFHPSKEILALAKKAGIKFFTIGSDAHKLEDLGSHLTEALTLLKEYNLPNCIFTCRKATPVSY